MYFNTDGYKNSFRLFRVVCNLFIFFLCYFIPTVLFLNYLLLTIPVGVQFHSTSIIIIPKTLESFFDLLEVEFSNTMVAFEVLGVDFLLPSCGWLKLLFFSVLYFFSALRFSSSLEFQEPIFKKTSPQRALI